MVRILLEAKATVSPGQSLTKAVLQRNTSLLSFLSWLKQPHTQINGAVVSLLNFHPRINW